jgi:excisionase family DNA binding protein
LTVQEVAELARCEHKAIRRAIRQGALRAYRPTKRLLIREDDAKAWIESRLVARYEPNLRPAPPSRISFTSAGAAGAGRGTKRHPVGA